MYVDVACVQIQRYLARTPTLRGRRTASAVLAWATRLDPPDSGSGSPALLAAVDGLAVPNDQAGVADGVVHLVACNGVAPEKVAVAVLGHLRTALPGAVFQAVWGVGPSYLEAYEHQIRPRLAAGEVLTDLPAVAEFPPVSPCRFCRSAAAVTRLPADPFAEETDQPRREQDACADCQMRYGLGSSRRRGRTSEERLVAHTGLRRPDELAELAALGLPGSGGNQLATVYADGNAIGDFFTALGNMPGADKTGVSRRLSQVTWDALAAAADAISRDGDSVLCAVPHVVGGDDLLVSVPADRGWRFTRVLLQHLDDGLAVLAADYGIDDPPSASAGIVFAAADYPFHLVVAAGEQVLRRAKNAVAGRRASIDFLDITEDGHTAPAQGPIALSALTRHAADLDLLAAKLPAHARGRQQDLRRHGIDGHLQAQADLVRTGHADLLAPFPGPDAPGGPDVIRAGQALRITRWWRNDEH